MSGNVFEWCHNISNANPPAGGIDPVGPTSGSNRVWRGGSWSSSDSYCQSGYRFYNLPDSRINGSLGFRIVRTK